MTSQHSIDLKHLARSIELADEAVAEQRAHARRYAELAGRHAGLQG